MILRISLGLVATQLAQAVFGEIVSEKGGIGFKYEPSQEEGFTPLTYSKDLMLAYDSEKVDLWFDDAESHKANGLADGSGDPSSVKIWDASFFDTYIVDRWTGEWKGGDTMWVVGVTKPVSPSSHYLYDLITKSIRILNDTVYQENEKVRFGLVDFNEHEDIRIALNDRGPATWVLKDGKAYRNHPMQDTYHFLYEFIELGWVKDDVYQVVPVYGRPTLIGIYLHYWTKEMRLGQQSINSHISQNYVYGWPAWWQNIVNQFLELSLDTQVGLLCLVCSLLMVIVVQTSLYLVKKCCLGQRKDKQRRLVE